jgi:hypothetical protein
MAWHHQDIAEGPCLSGHADSGKRANRISEIMAAASFSMEGDPLQLQALLVIAHPDTTWPFMESSQEPEG